MGNFRNKLINFMKGRYGIDEYGKFLFFSYLVLSVLIAIADVFVNGLAVVIARSLLTVLAVYTIFRMFSRSIYLRRNENERYKKVSSSIRSYFKLQKNKFRDRKTHVYKKCPYCKAVLRLKRIKGDHRAACPRCGKSFDVKV